MKKLIDIELTDTMSIVNSLGLGTQFREQVQAAADLICKQLEGGGVLYIAGNGGSAAQAEHFAAELMGKFTTWRTPIPAIAFTTNSAYHTAIKNDSDVCDEFSRQVDAICTCDDVLLLISTSAASMNIQAALEEAQYNRLVTPDIPTVALVGRLNDNPLCRDPDVVISLPDDPTTEDIEPHNLTRHVQVMHLITIHLLSTLIEKEIAQVTPEYEMPRM